MFQCKAKRLHSHTMNIALHVVNFEARAVALAWAAEEGLEICPSIGEPYHPRHAVHHRTGLQ